MKKSAIVLAVLMSVRVAIAGESMLTTTYQPLIGLGGAGITVVPVTCHHWYGHGASTAVGLIHARNVPPTDNPREANYDLNLVSICGFSFSLVDPAPHAERPVPIVLMDATKFDKSKSGYPKEEIIRASLECLRLSLPETLKSSKVTLKCRDADREWLSKIVAEFDSAPRDKPFYKTE